MSFMTSALKNKSLVQERYLRVQADYLWVLLWTCGSVVEYTCAKHKFTLCHNIKISYCAILCYNMSYVTIAVSLIVVTQPASSYAMNVTCVYVCLIKVSTNKVRYHDNIIL